MLTSSRAMLNATESDEQTSMLAKSGSPHFCRRFDRIVLSWKRSVARAMVAVSCALLWSATREDAGVELSV